MDDIPVITPGIMADDDLFLLDWIPPLRTQGHSGHLELRDLFNRYVCANSVRIDRQV